MSHPTGWRTLPTRTRLAAARRLRGVSIDLDALAATVASLAPGPRILEIGCGKGSLALALLRALPSGFEYLGVDPGERPGRRYAAVRRLGDLPDGAVAFRRLGSAELLPVEAGRFDLVLLVDVLHHAPEAERRPVLQDAARLVAPGGLVVVVDWARGRSWADLWCLLTCRWIPRDEHARFLDRAELDELMRSELSELEPVITTGVPPRRNNVLSVRRRPAGRG